MVGLVLILCLPACYTFVPAELESIAPGDQIRVFLTRDGVDRLGEAESEGIVDVSRPVVAGAVARSGTEGLSLRIPVATRQVGLLRSPLAQQVTLPRVSIVGVEARRLSRFRTAAAVITSTAVIGGVFLLIVRGGLNRTKAPPDYPVDARVPWP